MPMIVVKLETGRLAYAGLLVPVHQEQVSSLPRHRVLRLSRIRRAYSQMSYFATLVLTPFSLTRRTMAGQAAGRMTARTQTNSMLRTQAFAPVLAASMMNAPIGPTASRMVQ